MIMATTSQSTTAEQTVLRILRHLPPERARQLVDFARFLEFQTTAHDTEWLEETGETIRTGEEQWDRLLARPEAKDLLRDMAREAREEYQSGQTTDIEITDDGRLTSA